MHFLHAILFPILALDALVHGAPTKDDSDDGRFVDGRWLEDAPAYYCGHIYKGMYSRYVLRGREWFWREQFLVDAVRKSEPNCLLTNWRFREVPRNDSSRLVTFDMMVS
jgi:hypothetical protein